MRHAPGLAAGQLDAGEGGLRTQQRHTIARALELKPPRHAQALVPVNDPGGQLQLVVFIRGGQVVDFVAHHSHRPVKAPVLGQVQPQTLGVAPGAALKPGDVDGIVGMAKAVDVLAADAQVDDEGCCQVPAHFRFLGAKGDLAAICGAMSSPREPEAVVIGAGLPANQTPRRMAPAAIPMFATEAAPTLTASARASNSSTASLSRGSASTRW